MFTDLLIGFGIGAGFVTLSEVIRDIIYDRRQKRLNDVPIIDAQTNAQTDTQPKREVKEVTVDVRKEEAPEI